MDPILLLIIAYFFIALVAVTDKIIVTKALPQPVVYAFFVSTIGLVALLLIPFGFAVPPGPALLVSALAGAAYTIGIFFLYSALRHSEASRVFTTAGALAAVLTFVFSYWFLAERLAGQQILGFILLVIGGVIISLEFDGKKLVGPGLWFTLLTALAFGVSYTATKEVYSQQSFTAGFIWIRIFAFIAILFFLISAANRRSIAASFKQDSPIRRRGNQLLLVGGQASGGLGFLILNYVISLTSAAVALAAQGLQYAFLFVFGIILTKKFPRLIRENISRAVVVQKVLAIGFIGAGLIILAVYRL